MHRERDTVLNGTAPRLPFRDSKWRAKFGRHHTFCTND